ncbi:MAG: 3'-5' exonuclease, partial [Gemmatimonadaceae bacterium]
ETTIETLADVARKAGVPLLEAAGRDDLLGSMKSAPRTGLKEFATVIGGLRERAKEASVDELLRELVDAIRYGDYLQADSPETARDRSENVGALIDGAAEAVVDDGGEVGLTPLDHFLQKAMLVAQIDALDPNADAVSLMTLHNAKGLEYPVVFVTGLEDGLFPGINSMDDPERLEEERRLFYVGITRAERKLYLSHAETRRRNGQTMPSMRSRFLDDIPGLMLEDKKTIKARSSGRSSYSRESFGREPDFGKSGWRTNTSRVQHEVPAWRSGTTRAEMDVSMAQASYVPGERIRHKLFGGGRIAEVSGKGSDTKAVIEFDDAAVGTKTIKLAYTTLERGQS